MRFHQLTSMINSTNAYSTLKWPLVLFNCLIICLVLTLFLTYQSHTWFTYESYLINDKPDLYNRTEKRVRLLEYGSFGLWKLCLGHVFEQDTTCTSWTRRTRPEYFHVILVLLTSALALANLTIFPAWAAAILIVYNINNRYTRHVVIILWILFVFSLLITILLIFVMTLVGVTKYYSPGQFTYDSKSIIFHTGWGIFFLFFGTLITVVCLIFTIIAIIWKKFIAMRLIEEERHLYEQLTREQYSSSWHEVMRLPRDNTISDDYFEEPPPYR